MTTYYNFDCTTPIGSRGVTYWGYPNGQDVFLGPGEHYDFTFTCTQPKCYSNMDNCNASFTAWATSNCNPDVHLSYKLNSDTYPSEGCFISGVSGQSAFQVTDLSQMANYNDIGFNTFTIRNDSNSASVYIQQFRIMRIYEMRSLEQETEGGYCNDEVPVDSNGNLDTTTENHTGRQDFPCNYESCGGVSSTMVFLSPSSITLSANGGYQNWVFNWSEYSNNYVGSESDVCLFNFNQIVPYSTSSNSVRLDAYLNYSETPFATYFLSNQYNHGLAPSWN
jgi:hypothetical protein